MLDILIEMTQIHHIIQAAEQKCRNMACRTTPANRHAVRAAVRDVYGTLSMPEPYVVFARSPIAALLSWSIARFLCNREDRESSDIVSILDHAISVIEQAKSLSESEIRNALERIDHVINVQSDLPPTTSQVFDVLPLGLRVGNRKNSLVGQFVAPIFRAKKYMVRNMIETLEMIRNSQSVTLTDRSYTTVIHSSLSSVFLDDEMVQDPILFKATVGVDFVGTFLINTLIEWSECVIIDTSYLQDIFDIDVAQKFVEIPASYIDSCGPIMTLLSEAPFCLCDERFCIVSDYPVIHCRDSEFLLHNETGPSVRWSDGIETYHHRGIHVSRATIMNPETITIPDILNDWNQERRRVKIDKFGVEKLLGPETATIIDKSQYGCLWELLDLDDFRILSVENGTVEPDGTRKHYVIYVPPTCETALEAVAWTYGLPSMSYAERLIRRT